MVEGLAKPWIGLADRSVYAIDDPCAGHRPGEARVALSEEQDRVALWWLDELDDQAQWNRPFASSLDALSNLGHGSLSRSRGRVTPPTSILVTYEIAATPGFWSGRARLSEAGNPPRAAARPSGPLDETRATEIS